MPDRIIAAAAFVAAQRGRTDVTAAALNEALADEVTLRSALGVAEGRAAVLDAVGGPATASFFVGASWDEPLMDGDKVVATVTLPPGSTLAGVTYTFEFDDIDHIVHIAAQALPAPPPPATDVDLGPDIAEAVGGALLNGTPMLVAYVDGEDFVHISYRGTTQVVASDRIGLWARDPNGGLPRAVATKPNLTLLYVDPKSRTNYTFYGRASVTNDVAERSRIYDGSPEPERNLDPTRRGVALVVEIDRVEGTGPTGRVNMRRGAGVPA